MADGLKSYIPPFGILKVFLELQQQIMFLVLAWT